MTFQAWIYNNTGSTITPQLTTLHANAIDNFSATTTDLTAVNLQSCPNATWTQVAYTFVPGTSTDLGMEVALLFPAMTTTGRYVCITNVDIRVTPGVTTGLNSSPPPPELRPPGIELAYCQYYYQNTFNHGVTPAQAVGTNGAFGYLASNSGAVANNSTFTAFPVVMRTTPACTTYNPTNANSSAYDAQAATDLMISSIGLSDHNIRFTVTGAAGTVPGNLIRVHYALSSEL